MSSHTAKNKIHLGLMCINNELRKKDIFCSRSCIRKTYTVKKAQDLAIQNVKDISKLMQWNLDHKIYSLRVSSDLLPHYTDPDVEGYSLDFLKDELIQVGKDSITMKQRLTFHPGQFVQVGAKDKKIFEKSVDDLRMHCDIFDMMNLDDNSIVNIHLGGMYGDKESSKRRWIEQFDDLPKNVKARLTIENDEKCYSTRDCLDVATEIGIPVVLDNHHYECYSILHPDEEQEDIQLLITEVIDTWNDRQLLFHISEQDKSKKCGAHSDYISKLPDYYIDVPEIYNKDLWIDIEAKAKEASILKLYEVHTDLFE
jgi:UV DNA damage endonuclease